MQDAIFIPQIGIVVKGLADKTDLIDWAILYYIHNWGARPTAKTVLHNEKKFVWLSYKHALKEMPILHITTRPAFSRRISKLKQLGLIETVLDATGLLFVRLLPIAHEIFTHNNSIGESEEAVVPMSTPINQKATPVNLETTPVNPKATPVNSKATPVIPQYNGPLYDELTFTIYQDNNNNNYNNNNNNNNNNTSSSNDNKEFPNGNSLLCESETKHEQPLQKTPTLPVVDLQKASKKPRKAAKDEPDPRVAPTLRAFYEEFKAKFGTPPTTQHLNFGRDGKFIKQQPKELTAEVLTSAIKKFFASDNRYLTRSFRFQDFIQAFPHLLQEQKRARGGFIYGRSGCRYEPGTEYDVEAWRNIPGVEIIDADEIVEGKNDKETKHQ